MNCIIPFTKEVKFSTSIGEVTSISLEHEYNLNENILLGNFIVSGSYKTHELSVNSCEFSEVIPFDLSLPEAIDEKTFEFNIDNFTYEVYSPNILKIDISYLIKAKEIKTERLDIEFSDEPDGFNEMVIDSLENSLFTVDEYDVEKTLEEELEEKINQRIEMKNTTIDEVIEIKEEVKPFEDELIIDKEEVDDTTVETSDRTYEEEGTIMDFASKNEETFVTYKIHLMREGESVETISKMYQLEETLVLEYNTAIKFNPGDKVLIPEDE